MVGIITLQVNCTNRKSTEILLIIALTLIIGCDNTTNSSKQRIKTDKKNEFVFNFTSNSNDLENEVKILQTNNEITYHTFDFNKNLITFKTKNKRGHWDTYEFKIKRKIVKESMIGLKGMEFDIEHPQCFQVWVSTMSNIGYEFKNGQKLVFYGVKEIK